MTWDGTPPTVFLCPSLDDQLPPPGSYLSQCSHCGDTVWHDPEIRPVVEYYHDVPMLCPRCLLMAQGISVVH